MKKELEGEELDTSAAADVHPIAEGARLRAGGRVGVEEGFVAQVVINAQAPVVGVEVLFIVVDVEELIVREAVLRTQPRHIDIRGGKEREEEFVGFRRALGEAIVGNEPRAPAAAGTAVAADVTTAHVFPRVLRLPVARGEVQPIRDVPGGLAEEGLGLQGTLGLHKGDPAHAAGAATEGLLHVKDDGVVFPEIEEAHNPVHPAR